MKKEEGEKEDHGEEGRKRKSVRGGERKEISFTIFFHLLLLLTFLS